MLTFYLLTFFYTDDDEIECIFFLFHFYSFYMVSRFFLDFFFGFWNFLEHHIIYSFLCHFIYILLFFIIAVYSVEEIYLLVTGHCSGESWYIIISAEND